MKFTKPEARYLVQSARETLRWARRYEKTIKIEMTMLGISMNKIAACAAIVDTRRRDAAERMMLARRLEET